MSDESVARWPGRVAVAVTHADPPQVFIAEDHHVLSRVLALQLVARTDPSDFPDSALAEIRDALLEERWADAVVTWMDSTGEVVDAYPDEDLWTEARMSADTTTMEIRMARIFREHHEG